MYLTTWIDFSVWNKPGLIYKYLHPSDAKKSKGSHEQMDPNSDFITHSNIFKMY